MRHHNDDKLIEVRRINTDLAQIAERVARQADNVVRNARRRLARFDGINGARTWLGHGIFAHNLVKIAALVQ